MPELPPREEVLDEATARWLVQDGRPLVTEVLERFTPAVDAVEAVTWVRGREALPARAAAVVAAALARRDLAPRLALAGWPRDLEVLLSTAAAEQASHPVVSAHRAARFADATDVVDLGCGAGLDAIALARPASAVRAVDLDPARVVLCRHQALVAGVAVDASVDDLFNVAPQPDLVWHADPGRRNDGRRARTLAQTRPPSGAVASHLAGAAGGALVMGPAVAWDDPDLPEDAEVEFVQVDRQLVEATAWVGDLRRADTRATATRLVVEQGTVRTVTCSRSGPAPELPVGAIGAWLLDPAPALARARLHHEAALELGATRVATNRALCTADGPGPPDWWASWEVEAVLPGRPRTVRSWLDGAEPLPLSLQLHGVQGTDGPWWQRLRGMPRGPIGRRVHVIALPDTVQAVITRHASLSHFSGGR